jgi:4-amino-4-deoxy-L-arabinose transferase-like glycosyltransferase
MTKNKHYGRTVAASVAIASATAVFLLMANEGQVPRASLWGIVALIIAIGGLLKALVLPRGDLPSTDLLSLPAWRGHENEPVWAAPRITAAVALVLLVGLGSILGLAGLSWAIGAALLALVPSAFRRPGLALFVIVSALYLPLLGGYGLWDPWETHYGEVAREMLSRDDWISLWWAQDGWFWSKPIFIFWSSGLAWSALGIPYKPDAFPLHVEWALRLPIYLMVVGALLSVYALVARLFSRRAGLLAGLAVATMPHFFFLAHQAITDMPFAATMIVAMILLMATVTAAPEREAGNFKLGPLRLSGQHLVIGLLIMICLPQILYLASRNVTMVSGPLFEWHGDRFLHGSAGNSGIPGNAPLNMEEPQFRQLWAQPLAQAVVWLAGLVGLVWRLRRERNFQALCMAAFYIFCGLSVMAKGIPGVALPAIVALFFLLVSNRWSLLLEGRLRIGLGIPIVLLVSMPWFVAMYVRHGFGFTDRILIHDHLNRLASGVHGDNGPIGYFLAQLGYGMFPWIALGPAALSAWWYWQSENKSPSELVTKQRDVVQILMLWFTAGFTLYSAMVTKFHHYIFPVEPAAAVLMGLVMDRMLGAATERPRIRAVIGWVAILLAPAALAVGIAGFKGDVRGEAPPSVPLSEAMRWITDNRWPAWICVALIGLGLVLSIVSFWLLDRQSRSAAGSAERTVESACSGTSLGIALVCGAILCAFVAVDLMTVTTVRPTGHERLIHLFVYNYGRPWPAQFNFAPILTGFGCVCTAVTLLAAFSRLRAWGTRALLGMVVAFCFWCLNVYMIDLSPHWGQRELMAAYYQYRKGPEEPLVAWQMNWKGENLYTGNRIAVFVNLKDEEVMDWVKKRPGKRAFFVLEHSRLPRFKTMLGHRPVREITTVRDNNKFILISSVL